MPKECLRDTKLFFKYLSFNIRVKTLFFLGGPILAVFPYILAITVKLASQSR
jgi:hypothetical protein